MRYGENSKTIENALRETYNVKETDKPSLEAAQTAAARFEENKATFREGHGEWSPSAIDDLQSCISLLSGGSNVVLTDNRGLPSIMVWIPAIKQSELADNLPDEIHPVFTAFGKPLKGIYISKFQNIIVNGRGYSLPMRDPASKIRYIEAVKACASKGKGWGLSPFGLRAAVMLKERYKGFMAHGNNFHTRDYYNLEERGIPTKEGRVATGSGPVSWSHNNKSTGIWDMNGNLNEWDSGLRIVDGEIQITPGCEPLFEAENESLWRAILPDGSLTQPKDSRSLKFTSGGKGIQIVTGKPEFPTEPINCAFHDIEAQPGLEIPPIMKAYALYPAEPGGHYGNAWRWVRCQGEVRPLCGGASKAADHSGVFFMALTYGPNQEYHLSGFRSSFAQI